MILTKLIYSAEQKDQNPQQILAYRHSDFYGNGQKSSVLHLTTVPALYSTANK